MDLDDEWEKFMYNNNNNNNNNNNINDYKSLSNDMEDQNTLDAPPECSDIYISTKTKIIFLNSDVDIYKIFWELPIIDYNLQNTGIIKKQIKISLTSIEEINNIDNKLKNYDNVHNLILFDNIINDHLNDNIDKKNIKHVRKISIGICKKDLLTKKTQEKSAFYNCFVIFLRIKIASNFKEIHVKIFNTGKIEIPGIQNNEMFDIIIKDIVILLRKIIDDKIDIINNSIENVLINSNFNCGFYINRETLYNILRVKYNINAIYDPCSYPGIRCIYNYNNSNDEKTKISYMIFRTGSILIVGKCDEEALYAAYDYIKQIMHNEYTNIQTNTTVELKCNKKTKCKKKIIYISS
jgi:TATA-box binding protein (TBP) (component of TFIID and TFIIIB)